MDDFADGIIDKIIRLVEQDVDARPISRDLPSWFGRWRRRRR